MLIGAGAESGKPAYLPAICLVEVAYLVERGRIAANAFDRFVEEIGKERPCFSVVPLTFHIADAVRKIPRNLIPEMPDRIIAATANYLDLPLVTRDRRLRSSGIVTIW